MEIKLTSALLFLLILFSCAVAQEAEDALAALEYAEQNMNEMKNAGFAFGWVNDTLVSAQTAFDNGDYETVLELTNSINARKDRAYEISDILIALQTKIDRYEDEELDVTEVIPLFNDAKAEFADERYDEAEDFATQANERLEEIKANAATLGAQLDAASRNIVTYLRENWLAFIIQDLIIFFILLFVYDAYLRKKLKDNIVDTQIEQKVIVKLIEKAQDERYTKRSLSKKTYETKVRDYKKRILRIKQNLPVMQMMLDRRSIPLAIIENKLKKLRNRGR